MEDKKRKKLIIGVIIFVVIVAILVLVLLFMQKGRRGRVDITPTPTFTTDGHISVDRQSPGNSVVISNVTLSQPGFIVIHEEAGGNPGKLIGKSELLPIGTKSQVVVSLDRPSKSGEILFAILHNDDGSGTLEFPGPDLPAQNQAGTTVLARFKIK